MSTKTTLKRIALVAVSALGFGMFTAVAPASANAQVVPTSLVVGTIPQVRVAQTAYIPFRVYIPTAAGATTDTLIINAEAVAAPVATASNAASIFLAASGGDSNNNAAQRLFIGDSAGETVQLDTLANSGELTGRIDTARTTNGVTASGSAATGAFAAHSGPYVPSAAQKSQGFVDLVVGVTPDVAGTYTILISSSTRTGATAAATEVFAAGDVSATATFTTINQPTGLTITPLGGSTIHESSSNGIAVEITTTGGIPAGLEAVDLSVSGATGAQVAVATAANGRSPSGATWGTTASLPASYFVNGKAYAWVRVNATAATTVGTVQLTARGGGALPASVTSSRTFSVNPSVGSTTDMTYEAPGTTATYASTDASESSGTLTYTSLTTAQALGFSFTAYGATRYGFVTVTDDSGLLTGVKGLVYDRAYSVGSTAEGLTLAFAAAPTAATTTMFTVVIPDGVADTLGIASGASKVFSSATRDASGASFVITPATTFNVAPGTAVTFTVELDDRFGAAWAGQQVTLQTSGRNNPSASTLVTGADGKITFTTADTAASTSVQLIDTVTISHPRVATNATVTINYGNTAVGTITVTGGNTTASVNALTNTDRSISVGSSTAGAEAGALGITATVRDAAGNALAGVPVAFSVAGSGVAITTDTATVYTNSDGTAVGRIYAWLAGTYTYTATAGGKSTTGTITWVSNTPGNARVVSASVSGNVVTGKVVDRFGNPVIGVDLWAVTTSPANIGGAFSATGKTNRNGELSWVVSGNGKVTVTAVDPTLPAGSTAHQTCALAGNRTCATATTAAAAYSATVAGTATVREKFVGSSFAPAGVASVDVTVSAVDPAESAADAALEAIDAANAATDAANLAAEAADAATVAAEEARDAADAATAAVEALASEVATLIAGLKAQITTLANTVAKIAKRVRA